MHLVSEHREKFEARKEQVANAIAHAFHTKLLEMGDGVREVTWFSVKARDTASQKKRAA